MHESCVEVSRLGRDSDEGAREVVSCSKHTQVARLGRRHEAFVGCIQSVRGWIVKNSSSICTKTHEGCLLGFHTKVQTSCGHFDVEASAWL